MNRLVLSLVVLSLGAAAAARDDAPRLPPPDLLSHASEENYWIAQFQPPGRGVQSPRTAIRVKQRASSKPWERVIVLNGRILDLSHRGGSAAIVLEDRSWMLAWPGGSTSGHPLPGTATLLAIANEGETLWAAAIARDSDFVSTTQPATSSVEPPPSPSDPRRLMLLTYEQGAWIRQPNPPPSVPPEASIALAVRSGKPSIAVLVAPRKLAVHRLTEEGWSSEAIESGFDIRAFKFLETSSPMLWLAGPRGAGELRVHRGMWSAPIPLQASDDLAAADIRAASFFSGNIRLAWFDGAKVRERAFNTQGAPVGEAIDLGNFPPPTAVPLGNGTLVLLGVIGALLAINIMRVEEEAALAFGQRTVRLATLPRRLGAGLIDLLPVILTLLWRLPMYDATSAADALRSEGLFYWLLIAVGVYLLHTTIGEISSGRTVGKAACGLRVISVTGEAPRMRAVVLRNLFRLIDIIPGSLLMVLILFTPLRQRLGDVVAGTVVVMDAEQDESGDKNDR